MFQQAGPATGTDGRCWRGASPDLPSRGSGSHHNQALLSGVLATASRTGPGTGLPRRRARRQQEKCSARFPARQGV